MSRIVNIFLILALLTSCSGGRPGSGSNTGGGTEPPFYDFTEVEFNDTYWDANFISLLPAYPALSIAGTFGGPNDLDYFSFFLNPGQGATDIGFNFVVETEPWITPRVSIWQTIYNTFGVPTEDYQLIGTFVGSSGWLNVLDIGLPYDPLLSNDMYLQLEGYGAGTNEFYSIDFWSN